MTALWAVVPTGTEAALTTVRIFLAQMVREKALSFTPSLDPFYSQQNQVHLARLAQEVDANTNSRYRQLIEKAHEAPMT